MGIHHLMIGTWTPPGAIFTVQFNDDTLELKLLKRTEIPHDEPISWMAFDHAKRRLYGSAMKKWSSYEVRSPTDIVHEASHALGNDPEANAASSNTRAIFLLPAQTPPYAVYCNPFYDHAGVGNIFSVTDTGALDTNIQNYAYQANSGIHGMVFDPTGTFLYSADLKANKLWVHKKTPENDGRVDLVGSVDAPAPTDHPRWVAMHPSGQSLYALMEAGNRLCEYNIDAGTRLPVYTQRSFPLVPLAVETHCRDSGKGLYRSDVCTLDFSGRYLFATARSNSFDLAGYISAFRLDSSGRIEEQLCTEATPTSGGHSNAVSPCDFEVKGGTETWLALTDDQEGWLEMYRWNGESLAHVARLRIPEPGFGMNAIWYD